MFNVRFCLRITRLIGVKMKNRPQGVSSQSCASSHRDASTINTACARGIVVKYKSKITMAVSSANSSTNNGTNTQYRPRFLSRFYQGTRMLYGKGERRFLILLIRQLPGNYRSNQDRIPTFLSFGSGDAQVTYVTSTKMNGNMTRK